ALCGLVEQEYRRLLGEPLAEQDLLLIAATESAQWRVNCARRTHRQPLEPLLRSRLLGRAAEHTAFPERLQVGQRQVLPSAHRHHTTAGLAVGGDVSDALADGQIGTRGR